MHISRRKLRPMSEPLLKSRIESVKQSPLNAHRWCLQLDCGHDVWVTAKQRPRGRTAQCPQCDAKQYLLVPGGTP